MILLIDVGNTRLKTAVSNDGRIEMLASICHGGNWASVVEKLNIPFQVESVHVASVAGAESQENIAESLFNKLGLRAVFHCATQEGLGVHNGYKEPAQLGVDRWMAIIAGYRRARGAACIVDCGTTITIDLVAAQGEHKGGFIIPGLTMAKKSLLSGTKEIDVTKEVDVHRLSWGLSSEEAVYHGLMFSAVACVEQAFKVFQLSEPDAKLLLTGGDALGIAGYIDCALLVPELVLEGIYCSATLGV